MERALLGEIEKFADQPVTDAELAKAKNRLLTARLHERETCEGKASALANAVIVLGDPRRADMDLTRLQSVTAADIQWAVRAIFTEKNRLVLEYLPEAMRGAKK